MIFSVENGCFGYAKGPEILKDLNCSVGMGEIMTVLGPNGAGKTTLLRAMLGFLSWKSGSSKIDGRDIALMERRELWKKLSYVPQARNSRYGMSVFENVLLGRGSHIGVMQMPKDGDIAAAEKALLRLGIESLRDRPCDRISGGELQMVLIARALAAEPEILVLDEPESNLDFKNQLMILGVLKELAGEGMTCIFNTHYPAHALRYANKALMLGKGGKYVFGNAEEIVTEENLREYFGIEAKIGGETVDGSFYPDVIPIRLI